MDSNSRRLHENYFSLCKWPKNRAADVTKYGAADDRTAIVTQPSPDEENFVFKTTKILGCLIPSSPSPNVSHKNFPGSLLRDECLPVKWSSGSQFWFILVVDIVNRGQPKVLMALPKWHLLPPKLYRVFFFHWYPPKKLKYGEPRSGESTLT